MHAAPQTAHAHGMFEVEHLVEEQVLDRVARTGRPVKYPADDDSVVRGVIVAQRALGVVFAPGEFRTSHESAEEAKIQGIEYFVKVIEAAFWTEVALGAARSPNQLGLAGDGGAGRESLVAD